MKKLKTPLLMAAAIAIFFSCKKNSQVEPIAGANQEKQVVANKDNKKTNTNDGEDQHGCYVDFVDPNSIYYHDVQRREDCVADALNGSVTGIPPNATVKPLVPRFIPPPVNCYACTTTDMYYYFSLLGFSGTSSPTASDLTAMSTILASYNLIILNIFGDPLLSGHVNVPLDVAARRAAIAAFTGTITLPSGITMTDFLTYVDFAYSRVFAVDLIYTVDLFAPSLPLQIAPNLQTDPVDGIDKINTYGVKVLKPSQYYISAFGFFDETNLVVYADQVYY